MSFERSEILIPILDELESTDAVLFEGIQAKAPTQAASTGMAVSTVAVALIFQALRDELTKRGDAIVTEIDNVYKGADIVDFDKLAKARMPWKPPDSCKTP